MFDQGNNRESMTYTSKRSVVRQDRGFIPATTLVMLLVFLLGCLPSSLVSDRTNRDDVHPATQTAVAKSDVLPRQSSTNGRFAKGEHSFPGLNFEGRATKAKPTLADNHNPGGFAPWHYYWTPASLVLAWGAFQLDNSSEQEQQSGFRSRAPPSA
ncbi:MAG: hypothetical protein IKE42_22030 [Aquamicrobium sp.]|uniref:hypothetical protein n=1 Tax=Mesorhizobium sp. Pch-S TaxID=2082387 RepID=UPI0010128943|nr:hypothetical protein [Mesorhizobium sp. Pch-S]MBR2690539.1 hypothetical protein [Aquamicrobium sp.]QAZ43167.1 hypothetical protein C1M53_09475 [Mesorhizobium sp. Pch-S]